MSIKVTKQTAYIALMPKGLRITKQTAYVGLFPLPTRPRRRQRPIVS